MARAYISPSMRFSVLQKCNFACFYCGLPAQQGVVQLEIEHVVPVSQGGSDEHWNLVAACHECSAGKGADAPAEAVIIRAIQLFEHWPSRSRAVRFCRSCRRPWVPDWDDTEPNDDCWPCIHAWCDGLDYAKRKYA